MELVPTSYKQVAAGKFTPSIVPATNHCGLNDSQGEFRYECEIHYAPGALDSRGFLLDNTDFQRYFDSLSGIESSCEHVANQACDYFAKLLDARLAFVRLICVRIHPFSGVHIEASLEVNRAQA